MVVSKKGSLKPSLTKQQSFALCLRYGISVMFGILGIILIYTGTVYEKCVGVVSILFCFAGITAAEEDRQTWSNKK